MLSYNCCKLFDDHITKHMAEPVIRLLKVINIKQEKSVHGIFIF